MSTTVHQLVPSVVPGDATTAHTLELQRLLRDLGYRSEVFALAVHPDLEDRVQLLEELRGPSRRDAFLVYQCSAVSGMADWLIGRREALAVNYHNITPPELLHRFDRGLALSLRAGQIQVAQLARGAALGICDSAFNAADLHRRGFRSTTVAPILLDLGAFDAVPDPAVTRALAASRRAGGAQWLFVGTLSPHKAQHRLVQALALYRAVYDPGARLALVGRAATPGYDRAVRLLAARLGLDEAVDLPGAVTHAELVAYYRGADVYVSASRHEGFGVPLLEAMHHGVPVVALGAGAVPETLGDGAVVVDDDAAHRLAAAVHGVLGDDRARAAVAAAGRARLARFTLERSRAAMAGVVRRWVGAGGAWPVDDAADAADDAADVGAGDDAAAAGARADARTGAGTRTDAA